MVRAYFPQSFPNALVTNTNTPPQGSGIGGGVPVTSNELHEESSGVFGNLIYNDGVETGNVKIDEGPPVLSDFEIIEEIVGIIDDAIYDTGLDSGTVLVEET